MSERVSTTERVAAVLLAFDGGSGWLGVSEIARRTELSKAVVHRILQSLVGTGLLRYEPVRRSYGLGSAAVSLGHRAQLESDLRTAGMPIIAELAERTGETTTLSERTGLRRSYIGQVASAQPIRITITLGSWVPLTAGASGQSVLAHLDEAHVERALALRVPQYTERTLVDADAIRQRLALVRERGWAITSGERVRQSVGIAAPVFDALGEAVGALSVACLDSRVEDDDQVRRLAALVVRAAGDATVALQRRQRGGGSA